MGMSINNTFVGITKLVCTESPSLIIKVLLIELGLNKASTLFKKLNFNLIYTYMNLLD